jgi:hypothetical protein
MARKEGRNKTARKPRTWAQEAGKYYRKNVGKNGIESFTDVLKSADFKKQYYVKNGMKRGGDGEVAPAPASAPAPANTTEGEIQMPLNNVMGIMKTGGMMINKCKSMKMKMKMKGKMTKKKSLKNKKMTKKYMGGGKHYEIREMDNGNIIGYATMKTNTINNNTDKNNDETYSTDDSDSDSDSIEYDPDTDSQYEEMANKNNPKPLNTHTVENTKKNEPKPSTTINRLTNMFRKN